MSRSGSLRGARGFVLMLAVFMIVTLAAIGVYVVTVSTGQVLAVSQDELGTRAYQSARTGLDWGAFQVLQNGGACAASTTLTLGTMGGPAGADTFYAVVGCQGAAETEGAVSVSVYRITATGCNVNGCAPATPGQTYVERQLQLTITR